MAASDDKALMTLSAALLPLEIRKTLSSLTMEYTPADTAEAWYSKFTTIDATSRDLITANMFVTNPSPGGTGTYGSTRGETGADTTNTVTVANDKVKFLFIRHLGTTVDGGTANAADSIYINFDAGTAIHTDTSAFEIGPNEIWFCKPGCVAADIHVICAQKARAGTSSSTIACYVAAIIEDIGV